MTMSETATEPAQQTTRDLVRGFFGTVPGRYYLTTLPKDAAGRLDEDRLHAAIAELREATADESVGRITILLIYDEEA